MQFKATQPVYYFVQVTQTRSHTHTHRTTPHTRTQNPGRALQQLGMWDVDFVGIYDADEKNVGDVLRHRFDKDCGALHLGDAGNIWKISPDDIPNADGLISGPPCPPFSRIGTRNGFDDERVKVFDQVRAFIENLYRRDLVFYAFQVFPFVFTSHR